MAEIEDSTRQLIDQIWTLVEPVIRAEGFTVVEIEYRRESQGWVLRLFIDQEDGVTVDDCAHISQVVSDLLDVADPIPSHYNLEVSSPGLNRPLRKRQHFESHKGNVIEVRATAPLQGRKKFKGKLVDIRDEEIVMDCEGQIYQIPLNLLERARLCYFDSFEK